MPAGPRALVLGSAAGGGVPQWNCRCAVCRLAWDGDPRVVARTQSSLALTGDGERWVLVNASPDLGTQIRANPALHPRAGPRGSPITDVVLTNADLDHVAGLLTLRERHPFRLHATPAVLDALDASPVFSVLDPSLVTRAAIAPDAPFEAAGLALTLVAVPGKGPLYAEGSDTPALGVTGGETVALLARTEAGGTLAYVPACAALTPALAERLREADTVLFDGTLFTDDEMILAGLGAKTGRRMGHVPISGPGGSLPILAALPATRRIFVHINNTNPILVEGSPERRAVEEAGIAVGFDGLEIAL